MLTIPTSVPKRVPWFPSCFDPKVSSFSKSLNDTLYQLWGWNSFHDPSSSSFPCYVFHPIRINIIRNQTFVLEGSYCRVQNASTSYCWSMIIHHCMQNILSSCAFLGPRCIASLLMCEGVSRLNCTHSQRNLRRAIRTWPVILHRKIDLIFASHRFDTNKWLFKLCENS